MKKLLISLINGYRKLISPLSVPHCRYTPTCSQYALTAIDRFGAFKGTLLAGWRLLRCNPFSRGGYDPVPNLDGTYGDKADNNESEDINN